MALIHRIATLFTADVNAVLDRLEEPDLVVQQSLRDMAAALAGTRRRVTDLERQVTDIDARVTELDTQSDALATELEVCLDADDDQLARSVIRRQLQAQSLAGALRSRRSVLSKELDELQQDMHRQSEALAELEQKSDVLRKPLCVSGAQTTVADDQIEVALLKAKNARRKQ